VKCHNRPVGAPDDPSECRRLQASMHLRRSQRVCDENTYLTLSFVVVLPVRTTAVSHYFLPPPICPLHAPNLSSCSTIASGTDLLGFIATLAASH